MKILNFTIKEKNSKELMDLFNETSDIYGCTFEEVKKATLSFPHLQGIIMKEL